MRHDGHLQPARRIELRFQAGEMASTSSRNRFFSSVAPRRAFHHAIAPSSMQRTTLLISLSAEIMITERSRSRAWSLTQVST
jgi:hypothetical protein